MSSVKVVLVAAVNITKGTRVKYVSKVRIHPTGLPNLTVATAELAGTYNEEQAMREFRLNPTRFQFTESGRIITNGVMKLAA